MILTTHCWSYFSMWHAIPVALLGDAKPHWQVIVGRPGHSFESHPPKQSNLRHDWGMDLRKFVCIMGTLPQFLLVPLLCFFVSQRTQSRVTAYERGKLSPYNSTPKLLWPFFMPQLKYLLKQRCASSWWQDSLTFYLPFYWFSPMKIQKERCLCALDNKTDICLLLCIQ